MKSFMRNADLMFLFLNLSQKTGILGYAPATYDPEQNKW